MCSMTKVAMQHGSVLTFPWIKFLKPNHASVKPAKHDIHTFETGFICNQQWNLYTEHVPLQKEFSLPESFKYTLIIILIFSTYLHHHRHQSFGMMRNCRSSWSKEIRL